MSEIAIKIEHVSKEYRLGAIGGGTLRGDLQSWWARARGKEDPNLKLDQTTGRKGDRFLALDDVSIEVKKGEAVGIIGHNGAGKSTLLKLLSRVTAPTKGSISYNGRIASMLEVGTGFHPELTGRENVYMNGAILGMSKAEIDKKFDEIVAFAEMEKFIDTPVKRYSSGMYVKLAFAVAAHLDSEIMIMDEVLAVGDMKFQQKCLGKMGDAANNEGRTVLYVSHNMNTIRKLCSRCIVLDHGRVVFDGDVETAIGVYLGSAGILSLRNDCRNKKREAFCDGKIRMQMIEMLDLREPVLFDNQRLCVRILYDSDEAYENLMFRSIIFSEQGHPVGMAVSKSGISTCKGKNAVELEWSLDCLAPGQYSGRLVFYEVNSYGGETIHDIVDPGFSFIKEIKDTANSTTMIWKKAVWGDVTLPPVNVLR